MWSMKVLTVFHLKAYVRDRLCGFDKNRAAAHFSLQSDIHGSALLSSYSMELLKCSASHSAKLGAVTVPSPPNLPLLE